ncbi:peptidoglycan DD-metalloendopeptidase family protein [Variovorax sp. J22R133]|uniref:murein hydrolase activator EnvC family protein n=1 Tax=Variovorax brevis TaxID=3053503 RepID=UPI002576E7F6|nr:peptidoglycan DD-metalloendopeptidase family protein [Variovorax sp. J22R133]MDM0112070.1 peptidoglycan DD-metalloendopeptidase family protein [Variovorax sp. J22R133]
MDQTRRPLRLLQAISIALAASVLVACKTTPLPPPTPSTQAVPPVPKQIQPRFIRPANGVTIARFDGNSRKGIDIAGNLGDPVVASADGRVVYVGDELANYGNLIIVDHGDNFLTAYAHNQVSFVREKEVVRQGQQIASMGKTGTGAERVKLHFEIRKQGSAVDPEPYLSGKLR